MAREYFVFNRNYYEVVKALDDKQRLEMYDAICEFALNQNESKIEGLANALFSFIKPDILKGLTKYNNGVKGGRGNKANGKQNESKTKAKQKLTESKEETTFPEKKEAKKSIPFVQEETPLYPPKGGTVVDAQGKFFSIYCQFKKFANGEYPEIDFDKLTDEFAKSSTLRKTFSWQIILDSYQGILRGDFRDKVDAKAENQEYKADRERYYTALRTSAQDKADKIQARLMQYEPYAEIHKRLKAIDIEQAKAEYNGKMKEAAKLEQEKNRLLMKRANILAMNDLTEEDLLPRLKCRKCEDTGYRTEDGVACDCYKGA